MLSGEPFSVVLTLAPPRCGAQNDSKREGSSCDPWPRQVPLAVSVSGVAGNLSEFSAVLRNVSSPAAGMANGLTFTVSGVSVSALGTQTINVATLVVPGSAEKTATTMSCTFHAIPPILSILPPIVTLVLAVATKQVVPSLLVGVWVGALFVDGFNPITSFCNTFSKYFVDALTGSGHGPVILFACILGGVLELVDKSGGQRDWQWLPKRPRRLGSVRSSLPTCCPS